MSNKINERITCGRCGGLGRWCGGVCFRCNGHGKRLTPAARRLREELAEVNERLAKFRRLRNQENAIVRKVIELNEARREEIYAA